MGKKLISKATDDELYKYLKDIVAEIGALEDTRGRIENELTKRKYPNLAFDFTDIYIDINPQP